MQTTSFSLTITYCPLCGSNRSCEFDRRSSHGYVLLNQLCRDCGLVYLSPRFSDAELEEFYKREYRILNDGAAEPLEVHLSQQRQRAEHLAGISAQLRRSVNNHLDIGSSAGILLLTLQERWGCQSVGVEPSVAHREAAGGKGLQVFASLDEVLREVPQKFDLITVAHVLEHVPDPVPFLRLLRERALRPDGHILIEVPNLYGHSCFEPGHLVSFTSTTLERALQAAGYRVVFEKRHGIPRSQRRPLYLLVAAEPASTSAAPRARRGIGLAGRRGVQLRRWWSMRNSLTLRDFGVTVLRRMGRLSGRGR